MTAPTQAGDDDDLELRTPRSPWSQVRQVCRHCSETLVRDDGGWFSVRSFAYGCWGRPRLWGIFTRRHQPAAR